VAALFTQRRLCYYAVRRCLWAYSYRRGLALYLLQAQSCCNQYTRTGKAYSGVITSLDVTGWMTFVGPFLPHPPQRNAKKLLRLGWSLLHVGCYENFMWLRFIVFFEKIIHCFQNIFSLIPLRSNHFNGWRNSFLIGHQQPSQKQQTSSQNLTKSRLPLNEIFFPTGMLVKLL